MKKNTFDGDKTIRVFDFLTSLENKVEKLHKSEAQDFVALPTFLEDPDETQFRTNASGGSCLKQLSTSCVRMKPQQ